MARSAGRSAFGGDPASYHAVRPGYPDWVYETLCGLCGLRPGAAVFEVGAGTGTASERLLALGARPLLAIEPDPRMAGHLRERIASSELQVVLGAFEDADLPSGAFDLGVAATSFHWVEPAGGQAKALRLLKPGGWWAMVWNVFG
ncbi:class I SAM-dependent methyltransferase, partial [Phenylobacterium sp.]|uniref:class I SAM-dependent methyltransferase n=1 Tax=Phenylobacterium sp. TaxID=1871053 RepID=UPI00301C4995